ncbi:MAG: FmdB family transcriptional regulator [Nocardioidaceae bacterium]|nr:FmdB family transcriptional regulator [Nocardioidaceae bacterium]
MPTYQYLCNDCGHGFDVKQSFSDDALTVCPNCQGHLRKVFNAVGVVFKGSGFYRNDSRGTSTSTETSASSDSKPSTDKPASTETKSTGDSAPAAAKPAAAAAAPSTPAS